MHARNVVLTLCVFAGARRRTRQRSFARTCKVARLLGGHIIQVGLHLILLSIEILLRRQAHQTVTDLYSRARPCACPLPQVVSARFCPQRWHLHC